MTQTAQDILDFWFSDRVSAHWFDRSDEIDAEIVDRFAQTHALAQTGQLDGWLDAPDTALALTIALDQFPRNMFRGTPRAFASDDRARQVARVALQRGHDQKVPPERRHFFYLPFMHSELLEDQERSVALYEALGNEQTLPFAIDHRDIVARFGRFPHRNAALGRESTPEEVEFMKTHKGF